jgi:hypothetical protein
MNQVILYWGCLISGSPLVIVSDSIRYNVGRQEKDIPRDASLRVKGHP